MSLRDSFSIDFVFRSSKTDKKVGNIFARITINGGIPKEIGIKEKFQKSLWRSKEEKVTGPKEWAQSMNKEISDTRFHLTRHYRALIDQKGYTTAEEVRAAYLGRKTVVKNGHSLIELFDEHNKVYCKENLKQGSVKNYVATKQYLVNFLQSKYSKKDISLIEIESDFIREFNTYVLENPLNINDPCHKNGAAKHLERLRGIIKYGKKELKWMKTDPFEDYEILRNKRRVVKLNAHELAQIENQSINEPTLDLVRNLFIFGCYTGFAFAEVSTLNEDEDFYIGTSGKLWCSVYRKKSEELEAIPVFLPAIKIINKYKDTPASKSNGTIFPKITNQEVNRYLKILAEICGIKKRLTFHLARHTFATTVCLKNGVPLETLQKLLGHADIRSTKVYIEVDEEKLEEDTSGFWGDINNSWNFTIK